MSRGTSADFLLPPGQRCCDNIKGDVLKILIAIPRYCGGNIANYQYIFPLGLGYISSVLKNAGHHVECINLNHDDGAIDNLICEYLAVHNHFDFVCTGGVCAYYHQIKLICEAVRKAGNGTGLILGGGLISSEPELMFHELAPDYIIIGEGEETIVELLACLEKGERIVQVKGIGYKGQDGHFVLTDTREAIANPDSLPWPDFDAIGFETLLAHIRVTDDIIYYPYDFPRAYPIIASRSCPYLCTFCYHPLGNKYRQRSLDSVMEELDANIRRYRINIIVLYDECFAKNKERVYEFCDRIKKLLEDIPWECQWLCYIRVDDLEDELLKRMKDSGCFMVSYGFESCSQKVLESMRKRIKPQQIGGAVEKTLKHNLSIQANFIFGDVAETFETAGETLDFFKKNRVAGINLVFIIPYPGCEIYYRSISRGIIKDKLGLLENNMTGKNIINMTESMSDDDFALLQAKVREANLKYSFFAVPWSYCQNNTGNYTISVKCPHCGKIVVYRNCGTLGRFGSHPLHCRICRRRFYLVTRLGFICSRLALILLSLKNRRFKLIAYKFITAITT